MCHQVIEKILKALFFKQKMETPPYTHNLAYLADLTNIRNDLNDKQSQFLNELKPLNIESRYPQYKLMINKYLNQDICERLIKQTTELQSWIKEKL